MQFKVVLLDMKNQAKRQFFATFSVIVVLMAFLLPAQAVELGIKYQQGDMRYTRGYSLELNDNFVRRGNIYWTVAYNKLDKVFVQWNKRYLDFPMQTVEAGLSYRWSFRAQKYRNVGFELQLGGSVAMTENKFFWPELNEERLYSEKGDVSAFAAFSGRYAVTSDVSIEAGLKYFPDYFEFGDLTSGFVGFNYRFGRR